MKITEHRRSTPSRWLLERSKETTSAATLSHRRLLLRDAGEWWTGWGEQIIQELVRDGRAGLVRQVRPGRSDEIAARLQERRERHGISYVVLPAHTADVMAPVSARLA